MLPLYKSQNKDVIVERKRSHHFPPHLHEEIEIVYVTKGTLELGVGQELYHMDKGDFAIVFPNVIHHYQVFTSGINEAIYIGVKSALLSSYANELQKYCPKLPVIHSSNLNDDIVNSIIAISNMQNKNTKLIQAYLQIILTHVLTETELIEKDLISGDDIIYNAIEYVARNFRSNISLEKMSKDLGISQSSLSKMFAKTFHCNFNSYVNDVRLNYVTVLLNDSNESITNICYDCGFECQRTFNRVFKDKFRMSPRDYRKLTSSKNLNVNN